VERPANDRPFRNIIVSIRRKHRHLAEDEQSSKQLRCFDSNVDTDDSKSIICVADPTLRIQNRGISIQSPG
jgi:hypothetical protein